MSIERRLVDALKSKNSMKIERVFLEIYNANYRLVYFCVTHFVHVKEDIEEIVNDVFINFYNHIYNINIEGSIKYYLTRSARNACINYLKKKENQNITIDSTYLENITYVQYEYNDNLFIDKIKKILNKEEFNILFEHVVIGYSLKEIALKLNISLNTIKSKYRRSLKKIKDAFGGEYHE